MKLQSRYLTPQPTYFLVTLPRCGSTKLQTKLMQHPDIICSGRVITRGDLFPDNLRGTEAYGRYHNPDYRVFDGVFSQNPVKLFNYGYDNGKHIAGSIERKLSKTIIFKEEIGHRISAGSPENNSCNFSIFPEDYKHCIKSFKPAFIIRNPLDIAKSWKLNGWDIGVSFIVSYRNLYDTYMQCREILPQCLVVHFEDFTNALRLEKTLAKLFQYWNIWYDADLLNEIVNNEVPFQKESYIYNRSAEVDYFSNNPLHKQASSGEKFSQTGASSFRCVLTPEEETYILNNTFEMFEELSTFTLATAKA